jgi:hypothetical protein
VRELGSGLWHWEAPHPEWEGSDRTFDPHVFHGLTDVVDVLLERELRRVDATTTDPRSRYFSAYARM